MYRMTCPTRYHFFFFFNDTATTEIYTLSLHDALPISPPGGRRPRCLPPPGWVWSFDPLLSQRHLAVGVDRKSTRLNSSHSQISYAVFCLKKKTRWQSSPRSATPSCSKSVGSLPATCRD